MGFFTKNVVKVEENVDSIVASFQTTVERLLDRAEETEKRSEEIDNEIHFLIEEQNDMKVESSRARTIAEKIQNLLI